MPEPLSEQEFNAVRDEVLKSAPPNMDEATFNRWAPAQLAAALNEAETRKAGATGLMSTAKDALGTAATIALPYAAGKMLPMALPTVNRAAGFVAESPIAQKAIGTVIGGAIGAGTKTDMALDALVGGSLGDLVGQGAAKLAKLTNAARATVGRAANGQFVRLTKSPLTSVMEKLGPAATAAASEAAALNHLNSPDSMAKFADALTPEAKAKFLAYIQGNK